MKDLQKIEDVCNNLADAKYEIYQAIDTLKELKEMQSDDMAARQRGEMVADLDDIIRQQLQQVLDKAYEMQTEAEEQAYEAH